MSEKSCLYSLKNVGNCSNGGIKYKLGALLYISCSAEIKYYESTLKPLIVTFKDVVRAYIFFKWVFRFLSIYTLFQTDGGHRPTVFLSFPI